MAHAGSLGKGGFWKTWEIQIKSQLSKLMLPASLERMIATRIQENGLTLIPVTLPFDRLLITQAVHENMTLVSGDGRFGAYSVNVIW